MTPAPRQPRPPARRGVAAVMVLTTVAVAVVLAYAMLTTAATRSAISRNALRAAQLEQLAESGLNYAVHFLRYPDAAPGGATNWFQPDSFATKTPAPNSVYWPAGGTACTVDARPHLPGTFAVKVTWAPYFDGTSYTAQPPADRTVSDFRVESIGTIGGEQRTLTATVRRTTKFVPAAAVSGQTAIRIVPSMVVTGSGGAADTAKPAIQTPGTVELKVGSSVTGNVWNLSSFLGSTGFNGQKVPLSAQYTTPSSCVRIPGKNTIPLLEHMSTAAATPLRYTYAGTTCTAQLLPAGTALTATAGLPAVAATNPGRVFYCPGDLTLRSPPTITALLVPPNVVVNGTLVVDGVLRFGATGEVAGLPQAIEVTPVSGMPAVVCRGEIQFAGNKKAVTVNGLVHVVNGVFNTMALADTTPSSFTINGAVIAENASGNTFGSAAMPLTIKYDATKLNVVDFSTASNLTVTNVAVLEVR